MEQHQLDHLQNIWPSLQTSFQLTSVKLDDLVEKSVLQKFEVAELNAASIQDKKQKFIECFTKKPNGYDLLVTCFNDHGQIAAVSLLNSIEIPMDVHDGNPPDVNAEPPPANAPWRVMLPGKNIKREVLQKDQKDLISKMALKDSNKTIILDLISLTLFSDDDIGPILRNTYRTEKDRMTELFELIANLEPEEIITCMERLCNLDELPGKSKKMRDVLNKHFPNCVRQ